MSVTVSDVDVKNGRENRGSQINVVSSVLKKKIQSVQYNVETRFQRFGKESLTLDFRIVT